MSAAEAVRAVGVTKRYDGVAAVDGVDLGLAAGQVRGLLGPNGAGKTTLLGILLGLVEPDAGALHPAGARDLWALVRTLADAGTAVILSSHDVRAVESVCDAVTVLRAGAVVFDGALAALRAAAPYPSYRLVTSDDAAALRTGAPAVTSTDDGLRVRAGAADLDALVLDLARAGIAVRHLSPDGCPLQSLFFALTEPVAA